MQIAGIPREEIRHPRVVQDWLAEGRQEGRQKGGEEVSSSSLALTGCLRAAGVAFQPVFEGHLAPGPECVVAGSFRQASSGE